MVIDLLQFLDGLHGLLRGNLDIEFRKNYGMWLRSLNNIALDLNSNGKFVSILFFFLFLFLFWFFYGKTEEIKTDI